MKTSEQTTAKATTIKELNPASLSPSFEGFFYPASIWLDKHLNPVAKNLLAEISLLEQLPLGCIASNEHFATTLNVGKRSVERYIADLIKDEYLLLQSFDGHHRKLRVNFARFEPRQIGDPRQTGEVHRQNGEPQRQSGDLTSPKWRHNESLNKINTNVSTIEDQRDRDSGVKLSKEKPDLPKKVKPAKVGTQSVKKSKAKKAAPKEIKLPFASDTFKQAWDDWLKYRTEIKKPYRSTLSIQRILDKLAVFEEAFALELIEKSIANSWQGLVFAKTGEQYEAWLAAKKKVSQGTGTRAKPQPDLMNLTRQTNSVCHQLSALEKQRAQFKNYPMASLQVLHEQLQDLWRKAQSLKMFGSEIYRITALGNEVKQLINNQTKN